MRIDKWLWAARFFKTRALAIKACDMGRVASNGQAVKPAREVRTGDRLVVKNEGGEFHIDVLGVSEMRGPAAVAQSLYKETDESLAQRQKLAEERRAMPHFETERKPSTRDRRRIIRFRREE